MELGYHATMVHARNCPHRPKGRRWTRCNCSICVQGSLGKKWVKKPLSTRDWSVAAATIHEWEAAREIGGKPFVIPTISEALQNVDTLHSFRKTWKLRQRQPSSGWSTSEGF
jgi:hypothetical protein